MASSFCVYIAVVGRDEGDNKIVANEVVNSPKVDTVENDVRKILYNCM